MTSKKLHLTWQDIQEDTKKLANFLINQSSWIKIVAITRGGLIPAALLSYKLDIRLIETVCVSSYKETCEQTALKIFKPYEDTTRNIIVFDDLVDTGKTLQMIRKMLPHAFFVTLYAKPLGKENVDFYVKDVPQDSWIIFPWDTI